MPNQSQKSDFIAWKNHPLTKIIFEALEQKKQIIIEELAQGAGLDPLDDRCRVGMIRAFDEMLRITLDDFTDEEILDDSY